MLLSVLEVVIEVELQVKGFNVLCFMFVLIDVVIVGE